jgi:hypothetical protein
MRFRCQLLRWLDPEDAHRLAIQGLRLLPPIRRGRTMAKQSGPSV